LLTLLKIEKVYLYELKAHILTKIPSKHPPNGRNNKIRKLANS